MIYLYCFHDKYIYYKTYIDLLIIKYNFINLIIINNLDDISSNINSNINSNIKYLNNILLGTITKNLLDKLNKLDVPFYIYNTKKIHKYEDYSYIKNNNIQIIVYNYNDKIWLSRYSNNILYLPILYLHIQINNNIISKCDFLINCTNKDYNEIIMNELNKKNYGFAHVSELNNYNYKILININNTNNLCDEILLNHCVYNNILIINDKKNIINNNFLNEYIFNIEFELIIYFCEYLLNNYDIILKNRYKNLKQNEILIEKMSNTIFDTINHKNKLGFIILRHVNSELTNEYWIESYKSIRKYYNNKIIIIDDNSNTTYLTTIDLENCEIINTEFKQRGEILPYYYFYKFHFFEKAIIIHDSVFINKYINFDKYENFNFLWHFTHDWDEDEKEIELLKHLNNNHLINFYHKKKKWHGCYGVQCVIDYSFIKILQDKYNIFNLLQYIDCREKRMNFERIFGLLCIYEKNCNETPSIFGIIHHYIHWGYTYNNYLLDKEAHKLNNLDIIKVWSGR